MERATNGVRCDVCGEVRGVPFCELCGRSYDRHAHSDGSVMTAMVWAPRRARRFEQRRAKAKREGAR
jgi:hypothetical protein